MSETKKPLSFSMCPLNIAYVKEQVAAGKLTRSRYSVSEWGDDLITHLRLKAEAKPKAKTEQQIAVAKFVENNKTKRFVPPTQDEVFNYMKERDVVSDNEAQSFCDFYESNGWKVGKNKMKCWKASVRNWLKGYKKSNFSTKEIEHDDTLNDTSWAANLDDVL